MQRKGYERKVWYEYSYHYTGNVDCMSEWSRLMQTNALCIVILAVFSGTSGADESWEKSEGILITSDACDFAVYDDYVSICDLSSLLERMGNRTLMSNLSIRIYRMDPEGSLSPDAILPVAEVLYITDGSLRLKTDDEEIRAEKDEAVYIPPHKIRIFENAANETLQFYSFIDWSLASDNNNTSEMHLFSTPEEAQNRTRVISEDQITPLDRGDTDTNRSFQFSRLLHPREGPYAIGFDVGTAHIPSGSGVPDHYIDDRYQLMSVREGSGTISVGCHEYPLAKDDIMYIAPGAVMNLTADEDMHLMVLMNPYYQEMFDYEMPYACDYVYS